MTTSSLEQINQQIKDRDPSYYRESHQSYLTTTEWFNVEIATWFAQSLAQQKSMFQFPYFRQLATLWRLTFSSIWNAKQHTSWGKIVFSEHLLITLFVSICTSLEIIPRGIISLLLYPFLKKTNNSSMQTHFAEYFEGYAKKLHSVPFYDHNYQEDLSTLKSHYEQASDRTLVDWFSWKVISWELWSRKWISKPLQYWFHQEQNHTPNTTSAIVKIKTSDIQSALKTFQQVHEATILGDVIPNEKGTSAYAHLSIWRYNALPQIKEMTEKGIKLRKIAGQDQVQLKCYVSADKKQELIELMENTLSTQKSFLTSYQEPVNGSWIILLDIFAKNLQKTIELIEEKKVATTDFIHNF